MPAWGKQNGQCLALCESEVLAAPADNLIKTFLLILPIDEETFEALQISVQMALLLPRTAIADEMEGASVLSKIAKMAIQLVINFLFKNFFIERIIAEVTIATITKF